MAEAIVRRNRVGVAVVGRLEKEAEQASGKMSRVTNELPAFNIMSLKFELLNYFLENYFHGKNKFLNQKSNGIMSIPEVILLRRKR